MKDQAYKKILLCFLIALLIHLSPTLIKAQVFDKPELHKTNSFKKFSPQMKIKDNELTKIQKSDAEELIVEFSIPEFTVKKFIHKGTEFQIIKIPGFVQTCESGKPQLPVKGFLLGIPPGANISLEILNADFVKLPNYNILPAPKSVAKQNKKKLLPDENITYKFCLDQALYSTNNFYPYQTAKTGSTAFIRNQKVGCFQIFPIQFNPLTHEIRWYKKIKIKINFSTSALNMKTSEGRIDTSNPFEKLLKSSLLNYEIAKHWRQTSTSRPYYKSINKNYNFQTKGSWYKILIVYDGIYRINQNDLEQAGISTSFVDPRKIRIFNRGGEIPIYVKGQEDGIFNDSDYIEFYGVQTTNDYSYTNVYWLIIDKGINGLRMLEKDGSIKGTAPILSMSKETIHFEKETYFSTSIPDGEGVDHWFWDYIIAPDTLNFSVALNKVAEVSKNDCMFKAEYRGYTDTGVTPDHHTIVSLNGNLLLDDRWDGRIQFISQNNFPQSYLNEGTNTIFMNNPGDTGSESDIHYINWFEIEYWRDYFAQQDSLIFLGEGNGRYQFEVKNFSSNKITVFDISEISNVKKMINFVVDSTTVSSSLIFQDELNDKQRYFALTDNNKRVPKSIIIDEPSQLRSTNNQADYIIITHEDFYNYLTPLTNLRQNQGLNVKTIKIADIYDEFNFAIKDPKAIKDFLSYAYFNWQKPAPCYVLLVGDASNDYKDYLETGHKDYVPTHLFESEVYNTFTSSDNWFVCVCGEDNLPDMLIGRLPVRTTSDVEIIINKIIDYETHTGDNNWSKNILFVADNADSKGDYRWHSDYLADKFVTSDFIVHKAYLDDFETPDSLKNEIISRMNQGCLVVNYFGHGGVEFWAGEKLFKSADITSLNNYDNLPLVVSLSCLNGYFQHPTIPYCLSEKLLIANNGGAIASLAPSGFANTDALQILGEGLYTSLFQNQDYLLGSIVARSKINIFKVGDAYLDHIEFYNLLGDPALRLRKTPELSTLPSSYYGSITIDNNPAPVGSELSAWINNKNYPVDFIIRTPGKYGPTYINADSPNTPQIEGGVNGDTILFKIVPTNRDTFLLEPASIWEAGVTHNLDLNIISTSVRLTTPISIKISVNDKIVGEEIIDGDPIPNNSVITVAFEGKDNGVDRNKIRLSLNGQVFNEDQYAYIPQQQYPLHNSLLIFETKSLADGEYEMVIQVSDLSAPPNTSNKHFSFKISSSLRLQWVLNFPNPMQNSTNFTYYLFNNEPAEVKIKIYTVAGRLIRTINNAAGGVGYNETIWDGRDSNDDEIANGVYFYKIIAKDGEKITEYIQRMVKMR